jgi:hypothetical protein
MRTCTCTTPARSPNPRTPNHCNRCAGTIPTTRQRPLSLRCARCNHHFNPDIEGRAGIYFDRGGEGPDKLKFQEVVNVCGSCAEALRSYIGMRPDQLYRE